jgi:hypothetical protein
MISLLELDLVKQGASSLSKSLLASTIDQASLITLLQSQIEGLPISLTSDASRSLRLKAKMLMSTSKKKDDFQKRVLFLFNGVLIIDSTLKQSLQTC